MLTFEQLAKINISRCERWHDPSSWSPQMWGLAAAGKMGECCNALKKLHRNDEGTFSINQATSRAELVSNVAMEIGDVVVYLDLLAQRMGLRLEDCVRDTFNRISKREGFPERLDDEPGRMVPENVYRALIAWRGAEPSQSVLARSIDEWSKRQ